MEQSVAIAMLHHPSFDSKEPRVWADLGCGSGVFTQALGSLLPEGSSIFAVDSNEASLAKIPSIPGITVTTMVADFVGELHFPPLDGILMANSIHYVKQKEDLLQRLKGFLKHGGALMLVEYDMEKGNPWVPYPLSFSGMQTLLAKAGFGAPEKIGERRSVYNKAIMYSCISQLSRY